MADSSGVQRRAERVGYVLLTHYFGEGRRSIFPVQSHVHRLLARTDRHFRASRPSPAATLPCDANHIHIRSWLTPANRTQQCNARAIPRSGSVKKLFIPNISAGKSGNTNPVPACRPDFVRNEKIKRGDSDATNWLP
ncbi:hypothetical protein GCM10011591_36860 [Nocardia camponoti]|uniref:Uncharacterized protein n=1 Tax=Nocardia camponoti TaxID=1616106 RepID=A0A917QNZ7_9NOCA|nr:hypothetical protein GCM10011591_36860 [Nocardia camponoti]